MALSTSQQLGPVPDPQQWPASVISAEFTGPTPNSTPIPSLHKGRTGSEREGVVSGNLPKENN